MRRIYAFEAEDLSPEVKTQLEKVEDVVEDKCDTPEACDTMIEKIDGEKEKVNDALQTMADAAKDCKDGKCTKAEMAETIAPKMADLKKVAKDIGVASEGDALTEAEVKDAKAYLEGAKEIVEAKKDELENGEGCKKCDGDNDADDAECDSECETDEAEAEAEAAADEAMESTLFALGDVVYDMGMEGANVDALKFFRDTMRTCKGIKKEMKEAAKKKDWKTAAAKAKEAEATCDKAISALKNMPQSVSSAVLSNVGTMVLNFAASSVLAFVANKVVLAKIGLPMGNKELLATTVKGTAAGSLPVAALPPVAAILAKSINQQNAATRDYLTGKTDEVERPRAMKSMTPNDFNTVIQNAISLLKWVKSGYKGLASKYETYSKGTTLPGTESESANSDFDSFIEACESLIDDPFYGLGGKNDTPYLF